MSKLGTYTTFDCPIKKQVEALSFLQAKFAEINGTVKLINNPHDFGNYPSFEIDYPEDLTDLDEDVDTDQKFQELDLWHNKANQINKDYNQKFQDYL